MREAREERKKKKKGREKKGLGSRLGGKCGVKSRTRGIDESKKTDEETTRRSRENP